MSQVLMPHICVASLCPSTDRQVRSTDRQLTASLQARAANLFSGRANDGFNEDAMRVQIAAFDQFTE